MATRLLEECGEIASEINLWENSGIKCQKHGDPKQEAIAMQWLLTVKLKIELFLCIMGLISLRKNHQGTIVQVFANVFSNPCFWRVLDICPACS